jgi:DNA-binding NtrC family response regulator
VLEIKEDPRPLADIVREHIIAVCELTNWNLNQATRILDIAQKTLYNHLHRYEESGHVERVVMGEYLKKTKWQRRQQ